MKSSDMVAMPIEEFITALPMPAEVLVQLGHDNFICVCKAGDKATLEQFYVFQKNELGLPFNREIFRALQRLIHGEDARNL